jgi:putative oxidoreductase
LKQILGDKSNGVHATDAALIPTRAALGATMLYHGWDKLRRDHREHAARSFDSLGIRPGRFWAVATGVAEAAAGVLAIAGIYARAAAAAVLVTQAVAIAKVHGRKGFPVTKGGFEYNMTLMAIATALMLAGPGRYSVRQLVAPPRRGPRGLLAWLGWRGRTRRRPVALRLLDLLA